MNHFLFSLLEYTPFIVVTDMKLSVSKHLWNELMGLKRDFGLQLLEKAKGLYTGRK